MAQVQEVLADRYVLLDVLGRGGMGVVYSAKDRRLDRIVAVKVLPLHSAQDQVSVARFEREARAAAALTHRNIVTVFDSGRDDGTRFIVMERVLGSSLADLVRERGPLGVEEAVEICAQVAAALAAAHAAGIVHRDIKPANLMLDEHGTVKVLDFGIARLAGGTTLTQAATVLGSASYLAPELARGARADARSDIYALGCVMYELLTGAPPFTGEQPATILSQQLTAQPRRPEQLNPAVPSRLAELMLAMLAKDPDERPQHAGELVTELPATLRAPAANGRVGAAAPTLPLLRPGTAATTLVMPRARGGASISRRSAVAVATAIIGFAVVSLSLTAGSAGGGGRVRARTDRSSVIVPAHRQSPTTTVASVSAQTATPPPAKQEPPVPGVRPGPGDEHHPAGPPGHRPDGPHGSPPGHSPDHREKH